MEPHLCTTIPLGKYRNCISSLLILMENIYGMVFRPIVSDKKLNVNTFLRKDTIKLLPKILFSVISG